MAFAAALAACGGGESPDASATRLAGQMADAATTAQAPSAQPDAAPGLRARPLAAAPSHAPLPLAAPPAAVTADMVLDWAEFNFPDLFPKAVAVKSPSVDYEGKNYNARAYSGAWGTRYLGITPDGRVFGLGDFTAQRLQQFGTIAFWSAQVSADQCAVNPGSCPLASPAWVSNYHDSLNSGRSVFRGPDAGAQSCRVVLDANSASLPFPTVGRPVSASDGTIYVLGGYDWVPNPGKIYAVNSDCTLKWSRDLSGDPGNSSAAVGPNGTVYVHAHGEGNVASVHTLTAFAPDGTQLWQYKFNGGLALFNSSDLSSPNVAANGTIWVGGSGLFGFNPDGTLRCVAGSTSWIDSTPAIASDGSIYAVDAGHALHAKNPDCSHKWALVIVPDRFARNPQSVAISSDGTLYVSNGLDRNTLFAVNPDGTIKWTFVASDSIPGTPAIGKDGTIYFGTWGSVEAGLYAVAPNGIQRWKRRNNTYGSFGSPAIDRRGVVYWAIGIDMGSWDSDGNFRGEFQVPWGNTYTRSVGLVSEGRMAFATGMFFNEGITLELISSP